MPQIPPRPEETGRLIDSGRPEDTDTHSETGDTDTGDTDTGDTDTGEVQCEVLWETQSFPFIGADQTFSVPAGITEIEVRLWGAGGGAGPGASLYIVDSGGAGGFAQAHLAVVPDEVLTVVVGGGGVQIQNTAGYGFGGFGNNVNVGTDAARHNGTGGGLAGIFRGAVDQGTALAIAAGGGGGGHHTTYLSTWDLDGGAGGGESGVDGQSAPDNLVAGGTGGSQTGGGIGGTGNYSSGGNGQPLWGGQSRASGNDWYAGGCGGAGYFGGGGGGKYAVAGQPGAAGGGGGGGSSFVEPGSQEVALVPGAGTAPANQADEFYVIGVGIGAPGEGLGTDGGPGLVVIRHVSGSTCGQ